MRPRFGYGDKVRLIRNVRNDGTYPGVRRGELLLRRGIIGCVYDVGSYLQDQLIYSVHFLEAGRTVGCREEEIISSEDHWIPNRFEYHDLVVVRHTLTVNGQAVVDSGRQGQIEKVLVDAQDGVQYHVHFGDGRVFQVPEPVLELAELMESA